MDTLSPQIQSLRRYNVIAGSLHLIQAIIIVVMAKSFALPFGFAFLCKGFCTFLSI